MRKTLVAGVAMAFAAAVYAQTAEDAYGMKGSCGFSFGNGCDAGEPRSSLFGGTMGRRKLTPIRPLDT